jgi:hypothetical protein
MIFRIFTSAMCGKKERSDWGSYDKNAISTSYTYGASCKYSPLPD